MPAFNQTDNSTAATHRIPDGKSVEADGGKRPFNEEYLALMRHFGMTARTTAIGAKEQNGDVEASNGAIKRRLEQALLVRGHRDFESVSAWEEFVQLTLRKANERRGRRVADELAAMRPLVVAGAEFTEEDVTVSEWSTIRIRHNSYSVPSRLIEQTVRVRLFEDRIEVWFADKLQLSCERLRGQTSAALTTDIIWSLIRKPGGFARYVYRDEMFPSLVFRRAYDAIQTPHHGTKGDLEYLRILHLAASTVEADVAAALELLLAESAAVSSDAVRAIVSTARSPEIPALSRPDPDVDEYDSLLGDGVLGGAHQLREVGT
ncbi:MAG: hypothetical protein IPG04_29850 [Polyangiaceae bacterium]|nr:hypothetical protein [Polyangiaceae bacterium]